MIIRIIQFVTFKGAPKLIEGSGAEQTTDAGRMEGPSPVTPPAARGHKSKWQTNGNTGQITDTWLVDEETLGKGIVGKEENEGSATVSTLGSTGRPMG